jgi:hypothetical protein
MNEHAHPWPADAVERRSVKTLIPYARNARTHSAEQVDQLAASIREWGFTVPVLVDAGGEIIAGHGRVLAAEKIGLAEIPVMVARGWTQKQIKAYRIADNQLALNAAWDVKLLAAELGELRGMESLIGFSEKELVQFLAGHGNPGLTDPDEVPPVPVDPVTRRGDMWICGRHRIMCGDCRNAADVLIFDPFLGSGSTVIAAERAERCGLGMEISPAYVDVTVRRWQDFTGEAATLETDGRTFAAIQVERAPVAA